MRSPQGAEEVYHPGMLKVSPNSGFSMFKKKIAMEKEQEGAEMINKNSQNDKEKDTDKKEN